MCGWVDGHIADGAQKEECWKFSKLSSVAGCRLRSRVISRGGWNNLSEVFVPHLAAEGPRQDGNPLECRPQPAPWPGPAPPSPPPSPGPPPPPRSHPAPLSPLAQLTLGLSVHRCFHHLTPCTHGEVPRGAPRQPVFASTLHGGAPHAEAPGCNAWNQAFQPELGSVALCWGRRLEDRGGVGYALPSLPRLRPSGLETSALKWPFVYCPYRTGSLEGGAGTAGAAWAGWG